MELINKQGRILAVLGARLTVLVDGVFGNNGEPQ